MLLNPWSLTLCLLAGLTLFLLIMAGRTALRVLRFWEPASDSETQIRLEAEIWLSSTLVQYALVFQIISLLVYVLAADHFSQMLAGAMCATGSLLANDFGVPLLLVKIAGVFIYGLWIVLHQLDISSATYPLVRLKYIYLLLMLPLVITDVVLLVLYLAGLEPDIITSCCAIVFDQGRGGMVHNLVAAGSGQGLLLLYFGSAVLLVACGLLAWWRQHFVFYLCYGLGMTLFFGLALFTLITEISSFIYAMPFHNCPFCMLKGEYGYYGFALYVPLFLAVFTGITPMLIAALKGHGELRTTVEQLQRKMVVVSFSLLVLFTLLSSYHYLAYILLGGEG